MSKSIAVLLLAALAAFALPSARLRANVVPPIGLAPGQPYQLIFVTTDHITAVQGTEAPYNAFVNAEAAVGVPFGLPATVWSAVTSTIDGTSAIVNAPWLGLPVYNTQGIQVNIPGQSLYVGNIANPVLFDQKGALNNGFDAWTGSSANGALSNPLGAPNVTAGDPGQTAPQWLNNVALPAGLNLPLYALSGALVVPEPGTMTLFGSALLLLGAMRLLRRRHAV